MKQLKLTFLFTMLMSMVGFNVSAHDFELDGIYYLNNGDGSVSVTYKGNSSMQGYCEYSGNVVIPGSIYYNGRWRSVTCISQYAFHFCSGMTSVTIPNSVTRIEIRAFEGCSGLTSINIPSGIESIGQDAFEWCSNLTSITIPNSVRSVIYPFKGCSSLTSIEVESGNQYLDSRNSCNAIIETSTNRLIAGCMNTVIPNNVTSIGDRAFYGCTGLTSVTIPNSVTSIGNGAFSGCSSLTSITIPNSVTSIGDYAFSDCTGLTSISFPNNVTSIGGNAFNGTAWYDNQPDGLIYIGKFALKYKGTMPENTNITIKDGTLSIAGSAFSGCSGLTSIEIPNSVTSIGDNTFYNCSGLTSITIPNSVTSIGNGAFQFCSSLTSITIPNSVTSIGSAAFWECTSLTSITIPNSVTSINNQTFSGCTGLTSITIPNSVTSIGYYVFEGCTGLTSVTVDIETPLAINAYTFSNFNCANATLHVPYGCKAVYESANYWKNFNEIVEMPAPSPTIKFADINVKAICVANWDTDGDGELNEVEAAAVTELGGVFKGITNIKSFDELKYFTGLTSIGEYAFYNCTGLTSVTIPNSMTDISSFAFSGCSGLTSITIPNSVTDIGSYAFYGCSGLTSVTIPNSMTDISSFAFSGCSGLTSITIPNSVTSIGCGAYSGCSSLISIEIPNSVMSIGERAFDCCRRLTSVTIPNSVTDIGISAFHDCSGLTLVTIPNSVTSIGDYAFEGCTGLTSVTIPNSVTSIGSGAFYGCSSLNYIDIPTSVTSIGDYAFYECSDLTSITIPNSVTSIGHSVIFGCTGLTSITLHCKEIGSWIGGRVSINEVVIGDEVESIGEYAFSGCSGLTSITIPNSVTSIGDYAFSGCTGLTSITIPNSVTSIGDYAFYRCSDLTSVTIPNSMTDISSFAFSGCSGLTSVTIPNSVTRIDCYAFDFCTGLTSITIPNSVTYISNYAFDHCTSLISVKVESAKPISISGSSAFSNCTNATLYVPYGCKTVYEAANYWKEFKEIVEMPGLTLNDKTICKSGEIKLPVSMENEEEITAFQFDVEVPQGVTVTDVKLGDRKSDSHTVDFSKQADGSYRVVAVSLLKTPFSGNEGELVSLMLLADTEIEGGDYNIGIKNIVLTTPSKEKIYPEDVSSALTVLNRKQGDADGDGFVDVADVVAMIDYILDSSTSDIVFLAADMNADGEIDIFDVMIAINIVLKRENSAGSRTRASSNMEEQAIVTATADGIQLEVNDASRFTAFQFDVEVGDDMQLTDARLNGNAGNHELHYIKNGPNSYRVIGVSMDNSTLTACGDDLVKLSFSKGGCAQISNIVFVTPQKSKVCFACGNGEVTGIGHIRYEQAGTIYDLSGRKVETDRSRLPKGVYIINNKKVVIK